MGQYWQKQHQTSLITTQKWLPAVNNRNKLIEEWKERSEQQGGIGANF
jgi:hypothetical protein